MNQFRAFMGVMIFIIDALLIDNVHIINDADEYILFIKVKFHKHLNLMQCFDLFISNDAR